MTKPYRQWIGTVSWYMVNITCNLNEQEKLFQEKLKNSGYTIYYQRAPEISTCLHAHTSHNARNLSDVRDKDQSIDHVIERSESGTQ